MAEYRLTQGRHVVDEFDILNAWRNLFRGGEATPETLAKAEALLEGLTTETPLQFRLANELEELKKQQTKRTKTSSALGSPNDRPVPSQARTSGISRFVPSCAR